jgi:hypothetical protein
LTSIDCGYKVVDNFYTGGVHNMKRLDLIAAALVLVGGLNWGLVGVARFDLVAWIFGMDFGETSVASRIVYSLVGLAAVYGVVSLATSVRRPRTGPAAVARQA